MQPKRTKNKHTDTYGPEFRLYKILKDLEQENSDDYKY
jgi:hypothetical protein